MKCPKCKSENSEDIRFCEDCGAKMEKQCPSCIALIPLGKNLCAEYGHKLASLSEPASKDHSLDIKLEKIQHFLPGGLTKARPPDQIEKRKIQGINHRKKAMK
jgi:hypothetical protein